MLVTPGTFPFWFHSQFNRDIGGGAVVIEYLPPTDCATPCFILVALIEARSTQDTKRFSGNTQLFHI